MIDSADDADAHVRFQVALALGELTTIGAGEALARLATARRERSVDAGRDPELGGPHVDTLLLALLRERSRPGQSAAPSAMIGPLLSVAVSRHESGADRADHTDDRRRRPGRGVGTPHGNLRRLPGCSTLATTSHVDAISISTSRSRGSGRPLTGVIADDSAPEAERIGAAPA